MRVGGKDMAPSFTSISKAMGVRWKGYARFRAYITLFFRKSFKTKDSLKTPTSCLCSVISCGICVAGPLLNSFTSHWRIQWHVFNVVNHPNLPFLT